MSATTGIEWTDATVNFWWGCTKVGPGCDHCYAETWSKRTGGDHWGVGAPRRKIKSAPDLIQKLDNDKQRRRVFIQSMSDLFDLEVPEAWFLEAWALIGSCNRLSIQIVTKRISAVEKRLGGLRWPAHAGLVVTVVNQDEADRDIPRLLALKAKLGIPWVGLSVEPLIGPISFRWAKWDNWQDANGGLRQTVNELDGLKGIDWIIVGGESGKGARPMHPDWARSIRDQSIAAAVPFFMKQMGGALKARMEPIPDDLLVRQFPQ